MGDSPPLSKLSYRGFMDLSLAVFMLMTLLSISNAQITDNLNLVVIASVYVLLLYFRDFFRVYYRIIYIICSLGSFAIVVVFFAKSMNFENVIFSIFWILVIINPIFIVNTFKKSGFWPLVLNLGILNVIAGSLSDSQASILIFPIIVISLMFSFNSAFIYFGADFRDREFIRLRRGYASHLVLAFPGGALVSLIIFFAFPRMHNFPFNFGMGGSNRVGYSGEINLTGGGELKKTSEVVMYIESSDVKWLRSIGLSQLFRGKSLSAFTGKNWVDFQDKIDNKMPLIFNKQAVKNTNTRIITVHKMSSESKTIFYPGSYIGVWFSNSDERESFNHYTGELSLVGAKTGRYTYTVSFADMHSANILNDVPLSKVRGKALESRLEDFLLIPQDLMRSDWFSKWAQFVPREEGQTLLKFTNQVVQFFMEEYQVTLDNKFSREDALKNFATVAKRGHCEFFATSAAMMLRFWGVPTRVVLGYRGGTFNSLLEMLEIRTDDAHAWIEFWHPGYGWLPLDPTPTEAEDGGIAGVISQFKLYVSAADFLLKRYVSGYDANVQREILKNFGEIVTKENVQFADILKILKSNAAPGLVLILVLLCYFLLVRYSRVKSRILIYPKYYAYFLKCLKKSGITKEEGETIRTFHGRLVDHGFDIQLVSRLTSIIEGVLYAPPNEAPDKLQTMTGSVQDLVQRILKSKR